MLVMVFLGTDNGVFWWFVSNVEIVLVVDSEGLECGSISSSVMLLDETSFSFMLLTPVTFGSSWLWSTWGALSSIALESSEVLESSELELASLSWELESALESSESWLVEILLPWLFLHQSLNDQN